jgi:hypothetical protein
MSSDSMRGPKTPLERALESMMIQSGEKKTERKSRKDGDVAKTVRQPSAVSERASAAQRTAKDANRSVEFAKQKSNDSRASHASGGRKQQVVGTSSSRDPKTQGIVRTIATAFRLPVEDLRYTAADCAMATLPTRAQERNAYLLEIFQTKVSGRHLTVLDAFAGAGTDFFSIMSLLEQLIDSKAIRTGSVFTTQPIVDDDRCARFESNFDLYLATHGNRDGRIDAVFSNVVVETLLRCHFGDRGVPAFFNLIYADPPWPSPSSKATEAFIDIVKKTLFDPLVEIGAPPAAYICLKAPTPFSEFSRTLFTSSAYLTGYVFDNEIKMFNRYGDVVGYFHFLKFVGKDRRRS